MAKKKCKHKNIRFEHNVESGTFNAEVYIKCDGCDVEFFSLKYRERFTALTRSFGSNVASGIVLRNKIINKGERA